MRSEGRLRQTWAVAYYLGFIPMLRNPLFMAFLFTTPFTLLFILFVASEGVALPYGLAGALTMTTTELGLFVGTDLAMYKLQNKFQDIAIASPVSPLTYMFGVAISEIIFGAPALVILFILMGIYGAAVSSLLFAIGVVLLLWISTTAIGFFFSAFAPNTQNAFVINGFITTILSVLPPVYYSISLLPSVLVPVAMILPTTEASSLFQGTLGLGYSIDPLTSFAVLLVATVILLALVSFRMRWREN
ncbi:MAG TPA: ABC transporter permease [Methanomassiliicoccales archaeon]|nr:ABC transporter permease [Methanomassiliicoccales archaeon]